MDDNRRYEAFVRNRITELREQKGISCLLYTSLVHCDPGLFQHRDVLWALAPAHFLEGPLFLLRAEFCGLFSKERHHLRPCLLYPSRCV